MSDRGPGLTTGGYPAIQAVSVVPKDSDSGHIRSDVRILNQDFRWPPGRCRRCYRVRAFKPAQGRSPAKCRGCHTTDTDSRYASQNYLVSRLCSLMQESAPRVRKAPGCYRRAADARTECLRRYGLLGRGQTAHQAQVLPSQWRATSNRRLANAHSLSNHSIKLIRRWPLTYVWAPSTIAECES